MRYMQGVGSGVGSQGIMADWKAEIVNGFIEEHGITDMIEFGCGDGEVLSRIQCESVLGLDISEIAIKMCQRRFHDDKRYSFALYHPDNLPDVSAELVLSMDVLFHLVDDFTYHRYMHHMFNELARDWVIIYAKNSEQESGLASHMMYRVFTDDVPPEWTLHRHIPQKYYQPSDFYIFKRL
jgi:hypothetical protein